jgi:hypothetical protein
MAGSLAMVHSENRRWRMAARFEAARARNRRAKLTGSSAVRRSGKASPAAALDDDELDDELEDDELDDELEDDEPGDDELEDDELDDDRSVASVRTSAARK